MREQSGDLNSDETRLDTQSCNQPDDNNTGPGDDGNPGLVSNVAVPVTRIPGSAVLRVITLLMKHSSTASPATNVAMKPVPATPQVMTAATDTGSVMPPSRTWWRNRDRRCHVLSAW